MTAILVNPRERIRFLKFAVVGTIGAILDFGISNFLIQVWGSSLVLAGGISFIAAVFSNFFLNRYWTYTDSRSKPLSQQLLQFSLVSVIGLGIRVITLAVLEPIILRLLTASISQLSHLILKTIADNITLAITIVIVLFWNFFANRYWTYSDIEE
jgi:putative flippase GtrA